MLKLDSLLAFVTTAEAGSISEAARRLQISKSVASERLAELERNVGATLVHRSTRKLVLTEDGSAFLERAKRILREVSEATAEVSERRGELVGPLRISAPVSFGILHLASALSSFLREHPRIELSVDLDDRFVRAVEGLGIALLATFVFHNSLASGKLRLLDVGAEAEPATVFIAYPYARRVSAKVLALIAHLRAAFGTPPYWER